MLCVSFFFFLLFVIERSEVKTKSNVVDAFFFLLLWINQELNAFSLGFFVVVCGIFFAQMSVPGKKKLSTCPHYTPHTTACNAIAVSEQLNKWDTIPNNPPTELNLQGMTTCNENYSGEFGRGMKLHLLGSLFHRLFYSLLTYRLSIRIHQMAVVDSSSKFEYSIRSLNSCR